MPETNVLRRLPSTESIERLASFLLADGTLIVEDLLPASTLAALREDFKPHVQVADAAMRHLNENYQSFYGNRTRTVGAVCSKSRTFVMEVLPHPILVGLAERVLGPSCGSFLLSTALLIVPEPGMDRQFIHRDSSGWIYLPRPHPEFWLGLIIALVDFTEENGATCVIPGSHRWPDERQPEASEIHAATMKAGDAVLYLGSTLHAAGANRSNELRLGLHVSYIAGWLRPEENQSLVVHPHDVLHMPEICQKLLGYSIHDASAAGGGVIGHVDMRDPLDLLKQEKLPILK